MANIAKITYRKEHSAKTFKSPTYLMLGIAGTGIGVYYFLTQFNAERIEEWLPLGVALIGGLYFVIGNRANWRLPWSKNYFNQREYVLDADRNKFEVIFSSSWKSPFIESSFDLTRVDSFDYRIHTSTQTRTSTNVVHDQIKITPLGQSSPTGTHTETSTNTSTTRYTYLVLEPLGKEEHLTGAPESMDNFIEELNKKWKDLRK